MNVFTLLILDSSCDPVIEICDSYQQAQWELFQCCVDLLDRNEYPNFEDMYISDVIDIVTEERGFEWHIIESTISDSDMYRKGYAAGQQQMREQVEHLLKYTIHD